MNKNHLAVLAGAIAFGLPLSVAAQAGANDPTVAKPASPLRYDSAFADYKAWQDTKPADWRAVNDALRDAPMGGGHAGHGASAPAAQSATAAPKAAPVPAQPTKGSPAKPRTPAATPAGGHDGHAGHGDKK